MDWKIKRRDFVKYSTLSGAGLALTPIAGKAFPQSGLLERIADDFKPKTNIESVLRYPKTADSMPGKFPAGVVKIVHSESIKDDVINEAVVYDMVKAGMLNLTGKETLEEAYGLFFNKNERIGLKVNPVAGPTLSTSLEITKAIIKQLTEVGIPKENLLIWDRREFELHDCGFTEENFPGIKIIGTEQKDKSGSFYDAEGKLYGEKMIDREWYYYAETEEKYDEETLPYMVNEGRHSYFSKIVTQMVDKIINIPIMKNAGASITICLKNLAYGSVSNTGRLHKQLWSETSAEVCAFPPLRDKVVLNIVDGIKGCFDGGPGANPQFFFNYKTILLGTDAVAVDRVGYEIVIKKRIEAKQQEKESPRGRQFLELANKYGLGESDIAKINLKEVKLG